MGKTEEQIKEAANIVRALMTKADADCVKSIESIHEIARENYAINIWAGVVGRHARKIAEKTQGAVVVKTAKQREQVALRIIRDCSQ